jgi:hypothetical protein
MLREDMMPVFGLALGLRPPGSLGSEVPLRRDAREFKKLTDEHVFIGQASAGLKAGKTKWASPFKVGPHGPPAACVARYMNWISDQKDLLQDLDSLRGKTLVCDCPPEVPCHGDVISALCYEEFHLSHSLRERKAELRGRTRAKGGQRLRRVILMTAGMAPFARSAKPPMCDKSHAIEGPEEGTLTEKAPGGGKTSLSACLRGCFQRDGAAT